MAGITQSVVCAVYVDPSAYRCAYCGGELQSQAEKAEIGGLPQSMQIWCKNPNCPAYKVVGDVSILTLAASRHQRRVRT
jgi:hypothetical protein